MPKSQMHSKCRFPPECCQRRSAFQQCCRRTVLLTLVAALSVPTLSDALSVPKQGNAKWDFAPVRGYKQPTESQVSTSSLPKISAMRMVAENGDEEAAFELKVGKALDTLRSDYPGILSQQPDFEIYARDMGFVDPSGVQVNGLTSYKNSFRLLHALVKFLYCPNRSGLTFRMCYDKARRNIRIHWNAEVVPREIFGKKPLYVDGISVYEFNQTSGLITQHRIEHLLINNLPFRPPEGVIAAMRRQHAVQVPSFSKNEVVRFTLLPETGPFGSAGPSSSLFAMEASSGESSSSSGDDAFPGLDWEALEQKNKSRKKFGLAPLTPEEFIELEARVKQLAASTQAAAAAEMKKSTAKPKSNLFDKIFGALEDTCESNADCERPEICCDFGFKRMCCSSGTPVGAGESLYGKPALVPVPVDVDFGQGPMGRGRFW